MATNTYVPIATVTLGSASSTVTFSSIPATYRDLVLVVQGAVSSADTAGLRFNGDSGGNYFSVSMEGNGSSASSFSWSSVAQAYFGLMSTSQTTAVIHIMDYSATDKHTTFLARTGSAADRTRAHASRWANTAAVTSILLTTFGGVNYQAGTTFSLYGIAS